MTNHPSRQPTHHNPPACPRPADPKRPLPQSCITTACACRVSRQSWRASNRRPSRTTPNTLSPHSHAFCHPHNQARHTTQLHHDGPTITTSHCPYTHPAAVPTARLHRACNPTNLRTTQYTPIFHHLAPRHRAPHTHAMVCPTPATLFVRARYTLCEVESQGRPQHVPVPHTARIRTVA